jgi:APA family basic amino acid/polyamine antiporter
MRWNQLVGRKSLKALLEEMAGENRLRRALGPISLTALGVGCIIGAGIFVMTGRAAAEDAGPAVMVSYGVAALGCVFAALCYAEFAAMAPVAGSAYTYAYATLGELVAWIIGWDLILEYAMACACVAAAWGNYLNEFLKTMSKGAWEIPWWLSSDPFTTSGAVFNLPAVAIMAMITVILIIGIRESAITNAVLTFIKLGVVLFVIGLGMTMVDPANWTRIPHTQRLSSAELMVERVVGDQVRGDTPPHQVTSQQREQIRRESAYVRARLAADRIARLTKELVDNRELSAAEADAQVAAAQQRRAAAGEGIVDDGRFDAMIDRIEQQAAGAEMEKWGMIGQIIDPARLRPLDDAVRSNFAPYGFSGIMLGAAIVFFAFIGFDSISTHSEEAINPQRDIPIAILASLGICTVLYVLVAAVITGMEPYPEIDVKAAIAVAFSKQAEARDSGALRLSSLLISTGALAGMTSVLLVTFLSQARIFLAMARDKLLPHSVFGVVHPRFQTPHISTALTGLVICVAAAFTPIEALEKMVNIGTLFAFVIVCITVVILRVRDPLSPRPFRCPLLFVVGPLGVLVNLSMMLFLPASTWLRLIAWMGVGLIFYFAYGYRHSILGKELVETLAKEGIGPTDAPLKT